MNVIVYIIICGYLILQHEVLNLHLFIAFGKMFPIIFESVRKNKKDKEEKGIGIYTKPIFQKIKFIFDISQK